MPVHPFNVGCTPATEECRRSGVPQSMSEYRAAANGAGYSRERNEAFGTQTMSLLHGAAPWSCTSVRDILRGARNWGARAAPRPAGTAKQS